MKSTFEQMGGTYRKEGDYYIPNLIVPESPVLGIWARQRREFLMEHRSPIYNGMLLAGTLGGHLADTDKSAKAMFSQLIAQLAEAENLLGTRN